MKLATTLEAILYIKAQPLSLEELADTAGQPGTWWPMLFWN